MQQISMFDGHNKFIINKPIRLIELFAGYGSQHFALDYLGVNFESWKICEWAVKSIQAYRDAHFQNDNTDYSKDLKTNEIYNYLFNRKISSNYNEPMNFAQIKRLGEQKARKIYNNIKTTHNLVDIQQTHASDLEIVDTDKYDYIMTYSFPCGLAGTKIITKNGYKNIEDVTTNDYVLTHNNRFCKVNKVMSRLSNHYYALKGLGVPNLNLTENHPLYVLRDNKEQWVKVKDLKYTDMFAFNINQENIDIDLSNEYLWLLGRYVADGFVNKYLYNSVLFCIGNKKEQQFLDNIPQEMQSRFKVFQKACLEYRIADKTLQDYCLQFGNGALNKKIPQWIIDLPKDKLQSFFDGYIAGDGHIRYRKTTKQIMFSTTSQLLFLGLQQIIAKLYGCICSCYIREDNRKVAFNDTYNGQFNVDVKHRHQIVKDTKIFTKIKQINRIDTNIKVYNFEVLEDNSYTCNNVIVHNCQDLSLAGLGKGMEKGSGTRSGLLWEVERILDECNGNLPKVLLMENVPEVIGTNNIEHFAKWLEKLENLGYHCYWKVLNAKDFGIPQNRERCFMISILGDYYYEFPQKQKLELKLKDLLEDNVDEKYYLSDRQIEQIKKWNAFEKPLEHIYDEISGTLTTRYKKNDNLLKRELCNKIILEGKIKENDVIRHSYTNNRLNNGKKNMSRIENHNNLSPTLDTRCDCLGVCVNNNIKKETFTHTQMQMITKEGNIKRYINSDIVDKFEDGDCADISYPNGYGKGNRVTKQCSATITSTTSQNNLIIKEKSIDLDDLRIRKFTPKECFRLMGVRDNDFENIAKNQSNASLYHLAGDSIVVNVLMEIFRNLMQ